MVLLAPKRDQATQLQQQVTAEQAKLAQNQALLADYQKAKDSYRENYSALVRLGKAVPSDDDTRSLVVQLDAAAKRSGVDFDNIDTTAQSSGTSAGAAVGAPAATGASKTPPGAINAGQFAAMPFSFSFTGDFDGLSSFFSRLERLVTIDGDKVSVSGRLLRLESISLQPADNGWPGLHAQIGASSYIVPRADSGPAQGAAGSTTTPGTTTSTGNTTTASAGTSAANGDLR